MSRKTIATMLIVGAAVLLGMALRSANRADAAASDCFSDASGPATPTICN